MMDTNNDDASSNRYLERIQPLETILYANKSSRKTGIKDPANVFENLFKCCYCTFVTNRKTNLTHHEMRHKNEKLKFIRWEDYAYESHSKTNSKNIEKRKSKKSVRNQQMILPKINAVEIFNCDLCNYKTETKDHLTEHEAFHGNRNPVGLYKCNHCNYQTDLTKNLKRHEIIHKNIDVPFFKCYHCSYESKRKDNVKRHGRIHRYRHRRTHNSLGNKKTNN